MSLDAVWARIEQIQGLLSPAASTAPASAAPAAGFSEQLQQAQTASGPTTRGGTPGPAWAERLIARASQKYGVDPNLIRAVMRAESNFNPRAGSSAGAQGLMQLMPATSRGLGVKDPWDPAQNVDAGTRLLADNLKKYHGSIPLALAAYNAGPGAVAKYGGVPPYGETQAYIKKIMAELGL